VAFSAFESLIQPFYFDSQTINTVKLMYICIDIYTKYYRGGIYSGFDRTCCIISNTSVASAVKCRIKSVTTIQDHPILED
jgi:hypothetical protein